MLEDLLDDGYDILEALEMLAEEDHPELLEALVEAVEHHSKKVRISASLMLAREFQDVKALPGLREALYQGSRNERLEAASAIWEIGDAEPARLIRALHFERPNVRDGIVGALNLVGWFPEDPDREVTFRIATRGWEELIILGEKAVPGLVSALSDPDGNVRRGACWTLGHIGDARAAPFLVKMLDDESGDLLNIGSRVCDAAAEALQRIGTEEALAAVERWESTQEAE